MSRRRIKYPTPPNNYSLSRLFKISFYMGSARTGGPIKIIVNSGGGGVWAKTR